jgi:hypothetical protein
MAQVGGQRWWLPHSYFSSWHRKYWRKCALFLSLPARPQRKGRHFTGCMYNLLHQVFLCLQAWTLPVPGGTHALVAVNRETKTAPGGSEPPRLCRVGRESATVEGTRASENGFFRRAVISFFSSAYPCCRPHGVHAVNSQAHSPWDALPVSWSGDWLSSCLQIEIDARLPMAAVL